MIEFYVNLIDHRISNESKSARHYELWSPHEDAYLVRGFLTGTPYNELADSLQRKYTAVLGRLCQKGVLWYCPDEKGWFRNRKLFLTYRQVKMAQRAERNE